MATKKKRKPNLQKSQTKPRAAGKRAAGKKRTAASNGKAAQAKPEAGGSRRQLCAILLFAVGLLLFALTVVKGEHLWRVLHNFQFGLFGACAFFISPLILYLSILVAVDKSVSSLKAKLWQGGILLLLVSAALQVFAQGAVAGDTMFDKLSILYDQGASLQGGGVLGGLLAWPLLALFGRVPAAIVLIVLGLVLIMLLTGVTLMDILHLFKKPAAKREKGRPAKAPGLKKTPQEPHPRFEIDIPMEDEGTEDADPLPEHPVQAEPAPEPVVKKSLLGRHKKGKASKEPKPTGESGPLSPDLIDKATRQEIEQNAAPAAKEGERRIESTGGENGDGYKYPSVLLLKSGAGGENHDISDELKANAGVLVDTLKSFGVSTRIIDISRGPTVTRYELQPSAGVKISKITSLADDIALNLAAAGVRIEAPIPNKAAVGIEVPNKHVSTVHIRDILESPEFAGAPSKLTISLGKDIAGKTALGDIAKMPHVLIAGATGSGKSVCINSIIISLLYKSSPDDVRFLMVDPKVVELGVYNGIPHLLVPVVTDPRKAAGALHWAVNEMLGRYKLFADNNVRDLKGYNQFAKRTEGIYPLPQIVIIIDELADLMMAAPNEVEDAICRLAQMARAAGMHLVIATQRPSVDVITGVIKANIPSRIAFAVSSQVDSRTILDSGGAEKLLGRGDMLFFPVGAAKPTRIQGCFVSDKEVEAVVDFIKNADTAQYDEQIIEEIDKQAAPAKNDGEGGGFDDEDDMLPKAIECVVEAGQASTSMLQRRLKVGYARAGRLIDDMQAKGIVGPFEGSKPRQVLINRQQWIEMNLNSKD